jgi:hypothetical protein
MPEEVKLSRVESLFAELRYPVTRADAAAEFADTTVRLADGEANLGKLVSEVGSDSFSDAEELFAELQTVVPAEAVGDAGRPDGDA